MPAIRGTQCRSLPSSYRQRCQNAGRKRKVINHGNIIFRSSICIRSFWHTWYINKLRLWENVSKFLRNHHLRLVLCSASQIYVGVFEKFYGLLRIHLWSFTKDSKWRRNDTAVSEKFCLNNTEAIAQSYNTNRSKNFFRLRELLLSLLPHKEPLPITVAKTCSI